LIGQYCNRLSMFYFRDDLDDMDRCRWDKFNLNFEETQFAHNNLWMKNVCHFKVLLRHLTFFLNFVLENEAIFFKGHIDVWVHKKSKNKKAFPTIDSLNS
jgi:hypothetical protein